MTRYQSYCTLPRPEDPLDTENLVAAHVRSPSFSSVYLSILSVGSSTSSTGSCSSCSTTSECILRSLPDIFHASSSSFRRCENYYLENVFLNQMKNHFIIIISSLSDPSSPPSSSINACPCLSSSSSSTRIPSSRPLHQCSTRMFNLQSIFSFFNLGMEYSSGVICWSSIRSHSMGGNSITRIHACTILNGDSFYTLIWRILKTQSPINIRSFQILLSICIFTAGGYRIIQVKTFSAQELFWRSSSLQRYIYFRDQNGR